MHGEPLLLLAQVDDASGEVLAAAVEQLLAAGAANVEVLASVTKKGRPGHVLLVDVPADAEDEAAAVLAAELGVWGYHVLAGRHRRCEVAEETRHVVAELDGDRLVFDVGCKWISAKGARVRVKLQHDDLVAVEAELRARGRILPLPVLRARLEEQAWARADGEPLELRA